MSDNLSFDADATVSVFETNIRVLGTCTAHGGERPHKKSNSLLSLPGGLLSAHLLASDPSTGRGVPGYGGALLRLARELGERLLPAFNTPTGIPYGSVHLTRGVAHNESRVSSTAGGGTLVLEFGVLSKLTGDPRFEYAAKRALRALWSRRSPLGLVGAHIDVISGQWTQRDSGVGTSVDSFFEYLFKCGSLFGDAECGHMFAQAAASVTRHCGRAPWFVEVNMDSGTVVWPLFNALQAFWPGLLALAGRLKAAAHTHAAFLSVWHRLGFTPEGFNLAAQAVQPGQAGYPLRPELAESTWYLYRYTGDGAYLSAGRDMVVSLRRARAQCGYATVADVRTGLLTDGMESFFLSETVKYLFLLFDAGAHHGSRQAGAGAAAAGRAEGVVATGVNVVDNDRGVEYLFTTEGHYLPMRPEWRRQGPAGHDGVGAAAVVAPRNATEATEGGSGGSGGASSDMAPSVKAHAVHSVQTHVPAGGTRRARSATSRRFATAATDVLSGASARVAAVAGRLVYGGAHPWRLDGPQGVQVHVGGQQGVTHPGGGGGAAAGDSGVTEMHAGSPPAAATHPALSQLGTCPAVPSDLEDDDDEHGASRLADDVSPAGDAAAQLPAASAVVAAAVRQFGPTSPPVRALAAEVAAEQQRLVANHLLTHVAATGVALSDVQLHVTDTGQGVQKLVLWLTGDPAAQPQALWATNAPALLPNGLLAVPNMLPGTQQQQQQPVGQGQCGAPVVPPPPPGRPAGSAKGAAVPSGEDDGGDEYESPDSSDE